MPRQAQLRHDWVRRRYLPKRQDVQCIRGCVASGKSDGLFRVIRLALLAKKPVIVFKPERDTRDSRDFLTTRDGRRMRVPLVHVSRPADVLAHTFDAGQLIGFDEAQFWGPELAPVVRLLHERGFEVVVVGLDSDYRGLPFPGIAAVLTIPEITDVHMYGICVYCSSNRACCSQFVDKKGNPVPVTLEAAPVIVGFDFLPCCSECFFATTPGARETLLNATAPAPLTS